MLSTPGACPGLPAGLPARPGRSPLLLLLHGLLRRASSMGWKADETARLKGASPARERLGALLAISDDINEGPPAHDIRGSVMFYPFSLQCSIVRKASC